MADRGRGDGQEFEESGGPAPVVAPAGGGGPAVDVNSPAAQEIVNSLVTMGISRPVAEMVSRNIIVMRNYVVENSIWF